jgi:CheY-like chemotaxis protein
MEQNKKTILICGAEGVERDDLGSLLGKDGNSVIYASNAEDGISAAKNNQIDILVLDISENALNGYDFLESLTNDVVLSKVPIIILLADSKDEIDENKNITLGVKNFVIKSNDTAAEVGTKLLGDLGHAKSDPLHAEGFKILVVEDDNFLRDLLARKLSQENAQFIAAIDGENALKIIDQDKPSIVLLDLILPGIDGFEVLNKIKQNPEVKDVPVVILSNLGQDSDIQKAKELGADDFLIKANFSIDEVIAKIKELIGERS